MVKIQNSLNNTIGASNDGHANTLFVGAQDTSTIVQIKTNSSTSDGQITFTVAGVTNWSIGADASAASQFVICPSTTLGTNNAFVMNTAGIVSRPLQSGFTANRSSTQSIPFNTLTTVVFDTEVYDNQNEYDNTTGIYTATESGFHLITASLYMTAPSDTTTIEGFVSIGAQLIAYFIQPFFSLGGSVTCTIPLAVLWNLSATETIQINVQKLGGASAATVLGSAQSWFSVVKLT